MRCRIPFVVIVLMALFACEQESICPIDRQVNMRSGLYTRPDSTDIDTSINDVTIYGIGVGTSIYLDSNNLEQLVLPLSPYEDSSAFYIETEGKTDTLVFYYTREVIFFSEDCGFLTEFDQSRTEFKGGVIDSLSIEVERVSTVNEEHVKIYL